MIKLHVRKGHDDLYFESYKIWEKKVLEKGVSGTIGNNGNWDSSWAKGIKVYDVDLDDDYVNGFHFKHIEMIKMMEGSSNDDYFTVYLHSSLFLHLSRRTREQINTYLWNPEKSMFYDYDTFKKEQITYESVTCLWALWSEVASKEQAELLVKNALPRFEVEGGLVSGTVGSRGEIGVDRPNRQ